MTLAHHLSDSLRKAARAFTPGDQTPPCVVLWPDPERLWEHIIPQLRSALPELYALGPYAPADRTGPALWLRCIEGRTIEGAPAPELTPIFYLPGIGKETLRGVEECSMEVAALVELQFRGNVWLHINGKEWTPTAFLSSKHGGLDLNLASDQAAREAVLRSLPRLLEEPVENLKGRYLNTDHLNSLLAPDHPGLLLRWLSAPEAFQKQQSQAEWEAFCHQTKADYSLDVIKDGPLKAARDLAGRNWKWKFVWTRFTESPASFPGVVEWLWKASPQQKSLFDTPEFWPRLNDEEEKNLASALTALGTKSPAEITERLTALEAAHAPRRNYPWARLGKSPFANVLQPLCQLAVQCAAPLGAPSAQEFAEAYATTGWQVDAAAIAALEASRELDDPNPVLQMVRALYLPWVETTARLLQKQFESADRKPSKRAAVIELKPGRLVLFADGLRMDVAALLQSELKAEGITADRDWEWSTLPSVTATAKPAASPVSGQISGSETGEDFQPRLSSSGQLLTTDRFRTALTTSGWQILGPDDTGDPTGSAWTEAGSIDSRGHNEGWKLARSLGDERRELLIRISKLLAAGWKEIFVVTDHGWLLMPLGLPKVELKAYLTASKWGRCAALKPGATSDQATYPWYWNDEVEIACPAGAGSYIAGTEYTHGGVSLQEMVTPYLTVTSGSPNAGGSSIAEAKWTGAKCRVVVEGHSPGLLIDLRTTLGDPETSLLADRKPREVTPDGKATLFLESDSDIGKDAEIVLLSASRIAIHSISTTIGH